MVKWSKKDPHWGIFFCYLMKLTTEPPVRIVSGKFLTYPVGEKTIDENNLYMISVLFHKGKIVYH